jgi:hypothetical protein
VILILILIIINKPAKIAYTEVIYKISNNFQLWKLKGTRQNATKQLIREKMSPLTLNDCKLLSNINDILILSRLR